MEKADKEQLTALILDHCRDDKRFRNQVLSALEESGQWELASIKEVVKDSIRSNTRRGYIDEDGCDNICADLDDALDKARNRIERGQYGLALEITQFVLTTGIGLMDEYTDGLFLTIGAALETVGLAAKGLAESGSERGEWVRKLLKIAQDPMFDNWEDWQFDFLERIIVLADAQNEGEFDRVLLLLDNKRWENFRDTDHYTEQTNLIRYKIACAVRGPAAGRAFLEKHMALDMFRRMLVQEYMEEGNYAGAERLCLERLALGETLQRYTSNQWNYLLYEVYQKWGKRAKQTGQARKLALSGDMKFYEIAKELLTEDGQWQEEYPTFLSELEDALSTNQYMEILAAEEETTLLMDQVRVYRDRVFQYGGVLAGQYGEEVYGMCSAVIRQFAKRIGNRKDYQHLCGLLRSLVEFGGIAEAQALIRELRQTYPRRPALLEELEQVECEAADKERGTTLQTRLTGSTSPQAHTPFPDPPGSVSHGILSFSPR